MTLSKGAQSLVSRAQLAENYNISGPNSHARTHTNTCALKGTHWWIAYAGRERGENAMCVYSSPILLQHKEITPQHPCTWPSVLLRSLLYSWHSHSSSLKKAIHPFSNNLPPEAIMSVFPATSLLLNKVLINGEGKDVNQGSDFEKDCRLCEEMRQWEWLL